MNGYKTNTKDIKNVNYWTIDNMFFFICMTVFLECKLIKKKVPERNKLNYAFIIYIYYTFTSNQNQKSCILRCK